MIEQAVWFLKVIFFLMSESIRIRTEATGININPTLMTVGVVIMYITTLTWFIRLMLKSLGPILHLVGIALYVLVLVVAFNGI